MRMSSCLIIAGALLLPLQAIAQNGSSSGGVSGSGSGSAGVTTGTAPGAAKPNTPGTNSLGTAQSSGGVTTGSAAGSTSEDRKIQDENRQINQKLKGICKGC